MALSGGIAIWHGDIKFPAQPPKLAWNKDTVQKSYK